MNGKLKIGRKSYSAAQIIAGATGQTNGSENVTVLDGIEYLYQYRTEYPDGYYSDYVQPVCAPERANYLNVLDRAGHAIGRVSL